MRPQAVGIKLAQYYYPAEVAILSSKGGLYFIANNGGFLKQGPHIDPLNKRSVAHEKSRCLEKQRLSL
jgi:hypothetical protein